MGVLYGRITGCDPGRLWSSFIWEDHRECLLPCGPSQPLFFLGLVVCFLICTGWWSETSAGLPIPCVSTQAMVHSCLGASRCPTRVPFPMCARSFLHASLKACVCCLCCMKRDVCVHCFGSDVVSLENKQTSRSLWRITSQLGCLVSNLCTVAGQLGLARRVSGVAVVPTRKALTDDVQTPCLWRFFSYLAAIPLVCALLLCFAFPVQAKYCDFRQKARARSCTLTLVLFRKVSKANLEWRQSLCMGQRPQECM